MSGVELLLNCQLKNQVMLILFLLAKECVIGSLLSGIILKASNLVDLSLNVHMNIIQ